ncbi:pyruvate kinase [Clostridium sediminicola]|uniref:pyruvate kinase n=1 Tax=Clostridium sediminicola TaxID=3114879 RepID=UPI0031F24A1C
MQKTKMIFTIGPTSESEEVLSKLMEVGMNAARLNFSHGDHAEHLGRVELIRELAKKNKKQIALVLDTKGPEIRTGVFSEGKVTLEEGNEFTVVCGEDIEGDITRCSVSYRELYKDVKEGSTILIDDGLVGLTVVKVEGTNVLCKVANTGVVGSRKGVNLPGISTNLPALTEKDKGDLIFACKNGFDMIAASFIRKASDVIAIKKILEQNGAPDIKVISKIENQEGVDNIDKIIKYSDGIMVARGDMGVEIPLDQVPLVQKEIIKKCNQAGKFVITATQMLDSMMRNPRPTRAEASDIANAILDGTDAIMLSGETANGKYPIVAAETMSNIAKTAEKRIDYKSVLKRKVVEFQANVSSAISFATCTTAQELNAAAVVTATQTGNTARMVSKYRPQAPVIAVTPSERVARSLALNWGVYPLLAKMVYSTDALISESVDKAVEAGIVKNGDLVVVAAGIPVQYSGTTNMLKVHIVGDVLVKGKGAGNGPGYGTAKVITNIREAEDLIEDKDILIVKNLDKELLNLVDKVSGIVAETGGLTSHVAIECLAKDIPLICGADDATKIIKTGTYITLDPDRSVVYSGRASVK